MKIITNNIPRLLKYGYEMPEKFKSDFDYIDPADFDSHDFVEYKGHWYDLGEFMRIENNEELKGWNGYSCDSMFSGVLIKLVPGDSERVIIGRHCV